ncbi:MAG: NADPH-dependent 2,4-dienoyl-CoA reductase [Propionibacteriales bacterium]|nr:NADPH-dependent 2,4-dienoyl-CoA reductase [Propionibacteriales bacterium]
MSEAPYPHLLAPLETSGITLRNRVIMSAMHTGLEDDPDDFPKLAAYIAERAHGGVGLIVTGGFGVNGEGLLGEGSGMLTEPGQVEPHRLVTAAAHGGGAAIVLQIAHGGAYSDLPETLAPSAVRPPIKPTTPRAMTGDEIEACIEDFVRTAELARDAGYDGVEVLGHEGYLITEFLAERTNQRDDEWGGTPVKRRRLPVEIVRRVRTRLGEDFLVLYRISVLDLVDGGQRLVDVLDLACELEDAGVSILTSGFGWHESQVPTIASSVPQGAFAWATGRLREAVRVPVSASNRITMPAAAEDILARGDADLIAMARPFLADPAWVNKAAAGRADEINTCIGCNQACLDHLFTKKPVSCLVNPRAARETELILAPTRRRKRCAVVGAGPAGLAGALALAERGHEVELFEAADVLGGHFRVAREVPGKADFAETLRYFETRLAQLGVTVRLGSVVAADDLLARGFDEIVVATGVNARRPAIEGVDHPKVLGYSDVLLGRVLPGERVAVIGAGGIGVDVSVALTAPAPVPGEDPVETWSRHWGVTRDEEVPGALVAPSAETPAREVYLLQRSPGRIGRTLGKTTGWIHLAELRRRGVKSISGVTYDRVDDAGLHITVDGVQQVLEVDHVVLCAGQESERGLYEQLSEAGVSVHLVGGADVATEIDAKRAIEQATRLGYAL